MDILDGAQYVRLAPGAAERVAPYLGVSPGMIRELVLELDTWPSAIRPAPVRAGDGRLLAGDPVLLGADDAGLLLAGNIAGQGATWIPWSAVLEMRALEPLQALLGA